MHTIFVRHIYKPTINIRGLIFRDLLYIEEGNKNRNSSDILNMFKIAQLGDILLCVQTFQNRRYVGVVNEHIRSSIMDFYVITDEQAYERSLLLEPREH
jgi:hypothetical protein